MTDVQKTPLKRNLIEVAAIVVSILIAFALEASWESWQERQLGQAILADLAQEIRGNIADLDSAHNEQVIRIEILNQIIREAGTDRLGLDAETLNTLLASASTTPTFDMKAGVLDQLLQGGNLSLLESAELRNQLSLLC
jgi:hypothetical protein